jgi:hypothetical protein
MHPTGIRITREAYEALRRTLVRDCRVCYHVGWVGGAMMPSCHWNGLRRFVTFIALDGVVMVP